MMEILHLAILVQNGIEFQPELQAFVVIIQAIFVVMVLKIIDISPAPSLLSPFRKLGIFPFQCSIDEFHHSEMVEGKGPVSLIIDDAQDEAPQLLLLSTFKHLW